MKCTKVESWASLLLCTALSRATNLNYIIWHFRVHCSIVANIQHNVYEINR
jgi:hypothetical protein